MRNSKHGGGKPRRALRGAEERGRGEPAKHANQTKGRDGAEEETVRRGERAGGEDGVKEGTVGRKGRSGERDGPEEGTVGRKGRCGVAAATAGSARDGVWCAWRVSRVMFFPFPHTLQSIGQTGKEGIPAGEQRDPKCGRRGSSWAECVCRRGGRRGR